TQAEIAALAAVDIGDLSRALNRWGAEGVVFRVGLARLPFGLYALPIERGPSAGNSTADVDRASESVPHSGSRFAAVIAQAVRVRFSDTLIAVLDKADVV